MEETNPTLMQKLKRFYAECVRVLTITKKPNKTEFATVVKVSGMGMTIIGIIGFIITMVRQLVLK
jgi:protein transport protein SEC61 subunit gamma-like protein